MIRILIVDDHSIVRKGLKQIVEQQPDMIVAGEAQSAGEALQLVRKEGWDVVVLDINMPGRNGLEVLAEMRKRLSKTPVLILSIYPEEQYALRVLRAGAAGYLNKEAAPEELVKAIRKVHAGGKYVSARVAEELVSVLDPDTEKPAHQRLTDREYQVLCLIGSGKTVSQIGDELKLSVKTISTYRARILEKMELKSNAELMRYVMQNELTE